MFTNAFPTTFGVFVLKLRVHTFTILSVHRLSYRQRRSGGKFSFPAGLSLDVLLLITALLFVNACSQVMYDNRQYFPSAFSKIFDGFSQ